MRTSAFREVGGYRDLAPAEDTDLWLRLHDGGFRLACLPEVLGLYRVGTGSVSSLAYARQIQILMFSRHCHEARVGGRPEMTFEEYAKEFPLADDEVVSGRARLELRNAMGELLAGNLLRGGTSLARILVTRPGDLLHKFRTRCGRGTRSEPPSAAAG